MFVLNLYVCVLGRRRWKYVQNYPPPTVGMQTRTRKQNWTGQNFNKSIIHSVFTFVFTILCKNTYAMYFLRVEANSLLLLGDMSLRSRCSFLGRHPLKRQGQKLFSFNIENQWFVFGFRTVGHLQKPFWPLNPRR